MGFEFWPKKAKTPAQEQMDKRDKKVIGSLGAVAAVGLAGVAALDQEVKDIPMPSHAMPGAIAEAPEVPQGVDGASISKYDGINAPTVTIESAVPTVPPVMEGELDHEHSHVVEMEQANPVVVELDEKQTVIDSVEM